MKVEYTHKFLLEYKKLPKNIKKTWKQKLWLFIQDQRYPSLRIKKMQGYDYIWEFSINMNYRATFEYSDTGVLFRRIGNHDILLSP